MADTSRNTEMTKPRSEYRPFPNVSGRNARQARFEVSLLVSLLGVPKGKRMLEVGCGQGIALGPLQQLCRPIYLAGLDIDPALLATAEKSIEVGKGLVELIAGDVRKLPFDNASFDVVIDFGTCYHISEPERALAEIARVLTVGGLFVYETRLSRLIAHPVRSFGPGSRGMLRQTSSWIGTCGCGPAV